MGSTAGRRLATGQETREKLMRAAEPLLAARGIDGVPLREINRVAGQANRSAVQYHFGDRYGLVRAVLERHGAGDEVRRHALLDAYEQALGPDGPTGNRQELTALADALVLPLVAKLSDPDGGRDYLRIRADYYGRPAPADELIPDRRPGHSMERWHRLIEPLMPAAERDLLHSRFPAIRFAYAEIARRAAAPPHDDDELFASHLADLVVSMLESVPAPRTRELLERRRRRSG